MKVTPPSAARSRTEPAATSSIWRPKVIVPRHSLETFSPVRSSLMCWMAISDYPPSGSLIPWASPCPPHLKSPSVKLGELDLARIGLGTNRLTNTQHNVAFIRQAVEAGVQMIDTAHSYTGGQSEQTIGAALSEATGNFVVATKGGIGGPGQGKPEVLRAQIEQSLKSLRTDRITLYYLHRVDPETPIEESLAA